MRTPKAYHLVISEGSQTIPHLGVGFPLRCFQRLSVPDIATLRCPWQDSRHTRGRFNSVLSSRYSPVARSADYIFIPHLCSGWRRITRMCCRFQRNDSSPCKSARFKRTSRYGVSIRQRRIETSHGINFTMLYRVLQTVKYFAY